MNYWSKTHDTVTYRNRIDSFCYRNIINRLDKENTESITKNGITFYRDSIITHNEVIMVESVPNNYGGHDRIYYCCPKCKRRSRYLYCKQKHCLCRKCARLNYLSQQTTKGWETAYLKMSRIIRKLRGDTSLSVRDMQRYLPPRPKGMHLATYDRLLSELSQAQIEYFAVFLKKATRILGNLDI